MNNNKTVFFAIGVLLIILGASMLIPFFVQYIYGEQNNTFLSSASVTAFIGILLVISIVTFLIIRNHINFKKRDEVKL